MSSFDLQTHYRISILMFFRVEGTTVNSAITLSFGVSQRRGTQSGPEWLILLLKEKRQP